MQFSMATQFITDSIQLLHTGAAGKRDIVDITGQAKTIHEFRYFLDDGLKFSPDMITVVLKCDFHVGKNVFAYTVQVKLGSKVYEIAGFLQGFHTLEAGAWRQTNKIGKLRIIQIGLKMDGGQDLAIDTIKFK